MGTPARARSPEAKLFDLTCVNIGVLGHVDCGKTSLCKALSTKASTAAFDSSPQSKERGITLDLGFSAFSISNKYQVTLVDCPGHASLIRTVLGGVQIIDLMILVIDITKGMEPQTWECLVLATVVNCPLIVVLNKVDLLEPGVREKKIDKFSTLLNRALTQSKFVDVPIVPASTVDASIGTKGLVDALFDRIEKAELKRDIKSPFIIAVDHCFNIKGAGAVCTGTVLQGRAKINDVLEFPHLQATKKVKSMQVFRVPVDEARAGDRVALAFPGLDANSMERGLICAPGVIPSKTKAVIVRVSKIPYHKGDIDSGKRYHISIGYSTVTAQVQFMSPDPKSKEGRIDEDYDRKKHYLTERTLENLDPASPDVELDPRSYYALMVFDKPVHILPKTRVIGSNLQVPEEFQKCRLAFFGHVIDSCSEKDFDKGGYLQSLNIFWYKKKVGIVDRMLAPDVLVVRGFCKKESNVDHLIGLRVDIFGDKIPNEEEDPIQGKIESRFGQTDKIRVRLEKPLNERQMQFVRPKDVKHTPNLVNIILCDLEYKEYKFKVKAGTRRTLCQ